MANEGTGQSGEVEALCRDVAGCGAVGRKGDASRGEVHESSDALQHGGFDYSPAEAHEADRTSEECEDDSLYSGAADRDLHESLVVDHGRARTDSGELASTIATDTCSNGFVMVSESAASQESLVRSRGDSSGDEAYDMVEDEDVEDLDSPDADGFLVV